MRVTISSNEFHELRNVVLSTGNTEITKEFNKLFSNQYSKIKVCFEKPNVHLDIDEQFSIEILSVLIKHSTLLRSSSATLSSLPNLIKRGKDLVHDLKKLK